MFSNKRMEVITDYIQKNGLVTVKQLSQILNVTEKTIRLDLEKLEKLGILTRVHGGAISSGNKSEVYPDDKYRTRKISEKKEIALEALKLIKPNDTIILDDGSTTFELAKLLGDFPITVMTNDIKIVNELIKKNNITLYIVGGMVKNNEQSIYVSGDEANIFIKKFRFNKLFLGTSTVDCYDGLMIFQYGDKLIKRSFMSISKEIILLADSNKFNKSAFLTYADIGEIDTIITDSNITQDIADTYNKRCKNFIIAKKEYTI